MIRLPRPMTIWSVWGRCQQAARKFLPTSSMAGDARLSDVLRRSHLRMAWTAITLAGALLLTVGGIVLWLYLDSNLQLVARSLSYPMEALLAFQDRAAAGRVLEEVLRNEGVAWAHVLDSSGRVFAQWSPSSPSVTARLGEQLVAVVGLPQGSAPVVLDQRLVGHIVLGGDGVSLVRFLGAGIVVLGLCLGISGYAGLRQSRRMLSDIAEPLQDLADVARAARDDRLTDRRVPLARMAELRALGEDFNALLTELQIRQQRLRRQNSLLSKQALRDGLTGLANRLYFERRLRQAMADAADTERSLALLYFDMDRFKEVNDSLGHAAGDALLKEVGRRFQAQVRESDVVARLGGDEFAVLLYPVKGEMGMLAVTEKMLAAVGKPLVLEGGETLHPSVSVGVAMFPEHGTSMQDLLERADQSMYRDKAQRRNAASWAC